MVASRDVRSFESSAARVRRAAATMPGGVGSDFRLGISPTPLVVDHADGPHLFDVDGNRLIDYYLGMGPMLLGHNPPCVCEAVIAQLERGILFGAQSEVEYRAAELVIELVPCAEMVRFGSSGTEMVQAALRVARAATGRKKVLAFEGHYHGWLDNIAWGQNSRPLGLMPFSRGQDEHALASLDVIPWNDANRAVDRIAQGDLAAVIMEPAMCNSSAIAPAPG
jgi:glutamate-1-semialdehyde 2,1-aminomutase